MGKSARLLGAEIGRSAREMNALLKGYGYLDGEPNAYGVTEKGKQYAAEKHESRGTGGYSFYNAAWDLRTWDDDLLDALRADMQAGPPADPEPVEIPVQDVVTDSDEETVLEPAGGSSRAEPEVSPVAVAIVVAVVVGYVVVAPRVKPWLNDTVIPGAVKLRDRLKKRKPADPETLDGPEVS